jgi:hypothetical protein
VEGSSDRSPEVSAFQNFLNPPPSLPENALPAISNLETTISIRHEKPNFGEQPWQGNHPAF